MQSILKNIEIKGLFGIRDYKIPISENKLILVGENGSGKTTISRIIFATLSCDWDSLRLFQFDSIKIEFSNEEHIEVTSKMLNDVFMSTDSKIDYLMYRSNEKDISSSYLNLIIEMKNHLAEGKELKTIFRRRYGSIPIDFIYESINKPEINKLFQLTKRINSLFPAQIIYLPTYRRIEEQLKSIFPDIDKDGKNIKKNNNVNDKSIEMIEFGMDDVEELVKSFQTKLFDFSRNKQEKLTLGYLGEIVNEGYNKVDFLKVQNLEEKMILEVLERIDSQILSETQKKLVLDIIESVKTKGKSRKTLDKIVCHYFFKLFDFHEEITEAEKPFAKFQEKCNKYLVNNKIRYDSKSFTCNVINKVNETFNDNNIIKFQYLSSGEKQIVSLFSKLNLSDYKNVFVFIDEPELSLSVEWQRTFLPDLVDSANCIGLFATTHSPFIFDNNLDSFVFGINEFLC